MQTVVRNLIVLVVGLLLSGALMSPMSVTKAVNADDSFVSAAVEPVLGEPTPQNLSGFRKNLVKAAEQSFSDKEISRLDLFRIRVASMNPAVLRKMHQACAEQVLSEKKVASYGALDWDKLLAFIKEILPIILELIKMFS